MTESIRQGFPAVLDEPLERYAALHTTVSTDSSPAQGRPAMDRGAELQDLLLHAGQSAVPDSVLSDAIDARMAITQYTWTGIPWYLATCAEHIARVFLQGARFAGAMQFIDHRWVNEFAEAHLSRAKLLQEDLDERLRSQVAPVLAEYSSERDDVTLFASTVVLRPLFGSENPGHVALKKVGFACRGLAAIYRQTVGEFYSDLRFSPPHGFPAPLDGEYSMERPETWMQRLFAQEFSAAAHVPFVEAVMSEEWAQAGDWDGTELADLLGKMDLSLDEIGRATTRICGYLVSLSSAFLLIQHAASRTMASAEHLLRGVLVGAALAVNPDWGFQALEAVRRLPE